MLSLLLLACQGGSDTADTDAAAEAAWSYPLDDELRLTHVQVKGTHNSYHQRPDPVAVGEWDYSHAPLDVQLDDQGVRQFELDLHAGDGGWAVYHAPLIDQESSCPALSHCLEVLAAWSADHGGHLPIFIFLEPKETVEASDEAYRTMEEELLAGLGADAIVTPDEIRGDAETLADAVAEGWPTLGSLRGRFIFAMLDSGEHRDAYLAASPMLEGRLIFAEGHAGDAWAAVAKPDDPYSAQVAADVAAGLLVRTRADGGLVEDPDRLEVALSSGAHFLSTDFPGEGVSDSDYVVEVPDGTPARCNPVTAPASCTSAALEALR